MAELVKQADCYRWMTGKFEQLVSRDGGSKNNAFTTETHSSRISFQAVKTTSLSYLTKDIQKNDQLHLCAVISKASGL